MKLEDFLESMFPGAPNIGLPAFPRELANQLLDPHSREQISNMLAKAENSEVNLVLRHLRSMNAELIGEFQTSALEAYFSLPEVAIPLRGGLKTLFPNSRALPELDTDLLEQMLENTMDQS